jgi:hypothetical protein
MSSKSTGARNWKRLIEINSVDTQTHPLDKAGTGQVFGGLLTITGALVKVADHVNFALLSGGQNFEVSNVMSIFSISERGLALSWATNVRHTCIGNLYLDIVPIESGDMFFLPVHGDLFKESSQDGGNHLVGLALVQNAHFFERVGLISISIAKLEEFPRGWRVLGEQQMIGIV